MAEINNCQKLTYSIKFPAADYYHTYQQGLSRQAVHFTPFKFSIVPSAV
jgi:hypothetical protein